MKIYSSISSGKSEFSHQGYETSIVHHVLSLMMDYMRADYEPDEREIVGLFNRIMEEEAGKLSNNVFTEPVSLPEDYTKVFSDIDRIDMDDERSVRILPYIEKLKRALDSVLKNAEKGEYYIEPLANNYFTAYLNIIKTIVFNSENPYLYLRQFRQSKLMFHLCSLEKKLLTVNANNKAKSITYNCFSMFNPFCYDIFRRVLHRFAEDYLSVSNEDTLYGLRKQLYIRQVEQSFTRFTTYKRESSCRVALNRHNSELISHDYDKLSSISEIKPIRLLEKILVYINKELDRVDDFGNSSLDISVCIIGHTEPSSNGDERELLDLMRAVVRWYERSNRDEKPYPVLNLRITNIINEKDITSYSQKKRKECHYTYEKNIAVSKIIPCNYNSTFAFSTFDLKKICKDNDIIFILDCPWLTTEDFDLSQEGSLDLFCTDIQDLPIEDEESDRFDNSFNTLMEDIGIQLNRIVSSDTEEAGGITRVFKDGLIRRLEEFAAGDENNEKLMSAKQKCVYIFTSETNGIAYSYLGGYPLAREEMYEGKAATIVSFTNATADRIKLGKSRKAKFKIRLWSVLKYTSIAYAFIDFKTIIDECFGSSFLDTEKYFEILRDIIIFFDVDVSKNKVIIQINYSNRLEMLFDELSLGFSERNVVKNRLYPEVYEFVKHIYTDVVFCRAHESASFGDELVKDAFEMNLYSSANDVHTMVFYHQYFYNRILFDAAYDVTVLDYYEMVGDDNYSHDFFMDKRLYAAVLSDLMYSEELEVNTEIAFQHSERLFHDYQHKKRVLKNILSAYEQMKMKDDIVYKNALHAYWNL